MKQVTDTLTTLGIGAAGSVAAQAVNTIDPSTVQTVINIIVQVAIGIVTLWGLFKKNKAKPTV